MLSEAPKPLGNCSNEGVPGVEFRFWVLGFQGFRVQGLGLRRF